MKSIIADRLECKCHYTNFLWHKTWFDNDNQTNMNISMKNISNERQFEPTALVRNENTKIKNRVFCALLGS